MTGHALQLMVTIVFLLHLYGYILGFDVFGLASHAQFLVCCAVAFCAALD